MTEMIYIHQPLLEKWFGKIDASDAVIISYIHSWERNKESGDRYEEDDRYVWIHYKTLLKENPILSFKYDALKKRISNLRDLGILDGILVNDFYGRRKLYLRTKIKHKKVKKS